MDVIVVTLRLVHVVCGALWVGMAVFTAFFMVPAIQDAGPDGGKVMAALQRRGIMTVLPALALGTLVSGVWLYLRAAAGMHAEFAASPTGMAFGLGGLASIVAYALGITVMRPSMMRAVTLGQTLGGLTDASERERVMGEISKLRGRGVSVGRAVGGLLIFAVAAMGVARYL